MQGKILVFGADGLVGSRFTDLYHKETPFVTPSISELDISNTKSIEDFFAENEKEFQAVINFAAFTNVDEAEKERNNKKGPVWKVNADGPKNIAEACRKFSKYFIQTSTDFVFPGIKNNPGPYAEDAETPDSPDSISWYGWTKLEGERAVLKTYDNSAIVRISYPFRAHYPGKIDFARNILMLYDEGKLYPMFSDQKITPSFIDEIAKALYLLLEEKKTGIFHIASRTVTTPFEFASYLLEKTRGAKRAVKKGSLREFMKVAGRTPRPLFGGLKTEKTQEKLGITFMTWKEAIDEFVRQL